MLHLGVNLCICINLGLNWIVTVQNRKFWGKIVIILKIKDRSCKYQELDLGMDPFLVRQLDFPPVWFVDGRRRAVGHGDDWAGLNRRPAALVTHYSVLDCLGMSRWRRGVSDAHGGRHYRGERVTDLKTRKKTKRDGEEVMTQHWRGRPEFIFDESFSPMRACLRQELLSDKSLSTSSTSHGTTRTKI